MRPGQGETRVWPFLRPSASQTSEMSEDSQSQAVSVFCCIDLLGQEDLKILKPSAYIYGQYVRDVADLEPDGSKAINFAKALHAAHENANNELAGKCGEDAMQQKVMEAIENACVRPRIKNISGLIDGPVERGAESKFHR